jgi:hypothetical protein
VVLLSRSGFPFAVLLAAGLGANALASPLGNAIDLDPQSPTLGELLDREERARARPALPAPLPAAPPDKTGALPAARPALATPRISPIPHVPRGATTVVIPGRSPAIRQVYPPVAPIRPAGTRDF